MKIILLVSIFYFCQGFRLKSLDDAWTTFKDLHDKKHDESVEQHKTFNFHETAAQIIKHNLEADLGKHSYWMGLNEWSDLDEYDFMTKVTSGNPIVNDILYAAEGDDAEQFDDTIDDTSPVPDNLDYRTLKRVTEVKRQGFCRCSYAFAGVGALEGQYAGTHGKLVELSAQNIVDCVGRCGCSEGNPEEVYGYTKKNKGINTEKAYPFVARRLPKCKFDKKHIGAECKNWGRIDSGRESVLLAAVIKKGPVAVRVKLTNTHLKNYRSGIFDDSSCNKANQLHNMLVIGYGIEKVTKTKYWLIKNSMGKRWGEQGYMKLLKDKDNLCGIANNGTFPAVK